MKKRTLSLMALAAMMLSSASFVGCTQKDYGSDIEGLQKQITDNKTAIGLLQQAMAKGQMITKVETVATGYKLTMSDGSVLNLTNGKDGKDAPAAKLRVNAAKNWEVSTDNGTTWNEVKDADGNPIADAKTFVQNYVKINTDGKLVIGDKVTSFVYDVTIPQVTILQNELIALIAVPNADAVGGFDTARVPMEGYFDKWSVTGIKTVTGKTTLTVTKVELEAAASIDGVDYAAGATVYSSVGMPVVLNPSMIDASAIEFSMVASLEDGEAYTLPLQLKATAGTDHKISTITKAAPAQTGVWTINLASPEGYNLKGQATNVALCATNQNGTHTLSDYLFTVSGASTSSNSGNTSTVVDVEAYEHGAAKVAPAANIIASTLYVTPAPPARAGEAAPQVQILREDGSIVDGASGKYDSYTGAYYVDMPGRAAAPTTEVKLTYECLGEDGKVVTAKEVKVTFIQDTPVAQQYVIEEAFVPSGDNTAEVKDITKADLLAALFGDNSIAKAEFETKGINFKIEPDAKAAASGVTVEYYLDGSKVAAPTKTSDFNKVKITVPQKAFFAREYVPVEDLYTFKCTFQLGGNTPPTYTLGFDVLFALDGTSLVKAADWTGNEPEIAANATDVAVNLTDVTLYTDEGKLSAITTTGAVLEFSGIEDNDKVSLLVDPENNTYKLVRTGEAPQADETVSVTFLGTDAWGQEFSVTVNVTLKA